MATQYWDDASSTTTVGSTTANYLLTYTVTLGTNKVTVNHTTTASTGTATFTFELPPPPRRILVAAPSSWSREDALAFVRLVNSETKTGWRVGMLITGDILITDPDIETRSMRDFIPLLKQRAELLDRAKIDQFFQLHPAD